MVHRNNFVKVKQNKNGSWCFDCKADEFEEIWKDYFDLNQNYGTWFENIDPKDEYLTLAAQCGKGLRILKQDPWETLVCFIVSQRRSVPSITTCISKLCARFGTHSGNDEDVFFFPSAEALGEFCTADLEGCGMGYRDEYVLDAAKRVASGKIDLEAIQNASDDELIEELMQIKGVGIKVASCTALYGFHRLGIFPVDIWIKRMLEQHYPKGFPFERYPGYSGFLQLLMFYVARNI